MDKESYAVLELNLSSPSSGEYVVKAQFNDPESATDNHFTRSAPLNINELRQLVLDDPNYGQHLSQQLFAEQAIRDLFIHARGVTNARNSTLRVRLSIEESAATLHTIHWEKLTIPDDKESFIALNQHFIVSRYVSGEGWHPITRRPARNNLRVLAVIANPTNLEDYNLAPIKVEQEKQHITSSFQDEIHVDIIASQGQATLETIVQRFQNGTYHMLYLVAHGNFSQSQRPTLWLEKENGEADFVDGTKLVERFKQLYPRPLLVVLASCQSAGDGDHIEQQEQPEAEQGSSQNKGNNAGKALAALGPSLAKAGIPAVLAMQGNITQKTVAQFMPAFFNQLQNDGLIDRAVTVARGTVQQHTDWWMPVLFLRVTDGCLWDNKAADDKSVKAHDESSINQQDTTRRNTMTLIGLAVSLVLVTIGVGIFVFRLNGGRNTANTPIPSTEEPILIPIATETTTSVFPPEQQKPTEHIAPPATAVSTVSHSDTAVPEIPTPTSMATPDIQNLTGEQKKQLAEALVSAFPEYSKLKQMVSYRMEENLDVIVGKGPLSDVAFDLVEWAISQGEIGELIQAACQENPGNPDLQDFTEQMNIACPLPSNQGSEGPSSTSPMTGTFNILIEHSGDMNDAPQGFAAFIGDNLDSILNNSSEIVIQMDKLPQKRTLMSDLCESSVDVRVVIEQLKDESWDLTFYICDFLQEGIEVTKHFNQKPVAGENFTDKRTCMNELTDVVVLFLAGLKYLFNNEFVQASNFFADAIRKVEDPDYCIGESDTEQILDTLYLFHGRSLSASQQRELALQSYSQTLRLNPDYAWAYICIGNIYATQATEQDLVDYRKSKALQVNALENYVTALDICEKDHSDNCHPNAYIPGKTYINIGNVYNHWTSWPVLNEADARKYFEDAHVAYACALHFYGEDYECYDERLFSQNAKDTVPGRYIAHVYYAEGLLLEEEALRFSSEAKQKKKQALEMYQQCQKVLEGEDALSRDLQQLCQERIDKLSDIALFPTVL